MEAIVVEALIEIEADEMIEELEEQHIRYVDLWLVDPTPRALFWLAILEKSNKQKWQWDGIDKLKRIWKK